MLPVLFQFSIAKTRARLHRPYKEKEAILGFAVADEAYVMRGHVRLDTMNDENPRLFS
jgi:hypothetical protein